MLDIVQRYAPIVKAILKDPPRDKKILEVGGTGEGIGWYLPDYQIIDCDIEFKKKILPNTKPIKVKGVKLPFPDDSYNIAVSVDMLEHLTTRKKQAQAIKEMLRVAKQKVFLAVPTGKESLQVHQEFYRFLKRRKTNQDYRYLKEHLKLGHPEKEEILRMIKESGFKVKVRTEKNANIWLWLVFQKIYTLFPKFYHLFKYRRFWYYFLSPTLPLLNFGPTIRTIFYIEQNKA